MRAIRSCCRGSISVETGFMVPVVVLVVWLLSGLAAAWRLDGATHRATAALADLLANQRLGEGGSVLDLPETLSHPEEAFLQMVSGETSSQGGTRAKLRYGFRVTYLVHTPATGDEPAENRQKTSTYGNLGCTASDGESLERLVDDLVNDQSPNTLSMVRVDACVEAETNAFRTLIAPNSFTSSFVAARRD